MGRAVLSVSGAGRFQPRRRHFLLVRSRYWADGASQDFGANLARKRSRVSRRDPGIGVLRPEDVVASPGRRAIPGPNLVPRLFPAGRIVDAATTRKVLICSYF